jgi:hypothetical protein
MDALNFANGFGALGLASATGAMLAAAATRGCGSCAVAGGATATIDATAPAQPKQARRTRRLGDVAGSVVIEDWTAAPVGGVPEMLCSAPSAHSA